jgi:SAM-dependent methyltransferase
MEENPKEYVDLLSAASVTAKCILAQTLTPNSLSGRARFIYERAQELADLELSSSVAPVGWLGIGSDALHLLLSSWKAIAAQNLSGEELLRFRPQFWPRLMNEWPMGEYANLAVNFLTKERPFRDRRILEVGAGIGAVSKRMPELGTAHYVRTDINPFIAPRGLPGRVAYYDFNKEGIWHGFDIIFGVNAMHCARNPSLSIRFLAEMLSTGGILLLAEGQPTTTPRGTPWALNHFFGLFDGWWNIGGFRDRRAWLDDLTAAGLQEVGYCPYVSGEHELGGLVWGRKS